MADSGELARQVVTIHTGVDAGTLRQDCADTLLLLLQCPPIIAPPLMHTTSHNRCPAAALFDTQTLTAKKSTGNGTAECRMVTKPAGLSLYTARCNRTGYLIPNTHVNVSNSVQIFPAVGHLPSTCGSTDKQCWVYARDPATGAEGWMPHDLPNQPQKLACGFAQGEKWMDCCAAGTACTTRDLCVGKTCSGHGTCAEGWCYCEKGWAGGDCERAGEE